MRKLDKNKIEQFEKDLEMLSSWELSKKYGTPYRHTDGFAFLGDWKHWLYTLKAHSRNRIHATKIGKHREYGERILREKGSGWTYPLISARHSFIIETIEAQEEFLGEEFLKHFYLDEAAAKAA